MSKIIIFGIQEFAEIAHYYLTNDSEHEVVAFCVNQEYIPDNPFFKSLPIIPFETIEEHFPQNEFKFFAPMSSREMNTFRERIYNSIKEKGYELISYVSSKVVKNNCKIGDNCFIQEGNALHPFTEIGNNVMLWSNNMIGHHGVVKDHVTFAGQVALVGRCTIGENSFLAVNSTVRENTTLAKGTLVSIASVITNDTEEWSVYMGNPAKRIGKGISKSILKF